MRLLDKDRDKHVVKAEDVARGNGFQSLRDEILRRAAPEAGESALDIGAWRLRTTAFTTLDRLTVRRSQDADPLGQARARSVSTADSTGSYLLQSVGMAAQSL